MDEKSEMTDTQVHQLFLLAAYFSGVLVQSLNIRGDEVTATIDCRPDIQINKSSLSKMTILELGDLLKEENHEEGLNERVN